ncbi:MAG: M43 family zinc metalloprotease [Niastella sp.]|uniref:M43 family zinc metalloprotease n=1 Tax=Niastella sp. TaxID=1869183 RepID=UPI00389A1ED1
MSYLNYYLRKKIIYLKVISRLAIISIWVLGNRNYSLAQENGLIRQCGTMQVLEHTFKNKPLLKATFQKQTGEFLQSVHKRKTTGPSLRIEGNVIYVPVIFHIVLTNPAVITDAQIQAQLDVLNKDFAGMNSDSVNLPAAFKPLFGKSQIQFKLAQRTPDNEPSNGIVRVTTARPVYSTFDIGLKYSTLGGDDAWDPGRFLNVWITNLSAGFVLGYSTLPGASVPAEEGIVVHYTTLPADSLTRTNRGRTLTHEAGHFFYLYHIWGDENGCTGTDFVDDTPNQATLTSGCPGGAIVTDGCSPIAPGILYQNYMDYTDDPCMSLFTWGQVSRMETALSDFHAGYFTSNGADPVPLFSLDAAVKKITTPDQRVCSATLSPVITLRNRGIETLSSADLYASIDNGPAILTHWAGSLLSLDETIITLNTLTIATEGSHVLKVVVESPNGHTDLNGANDTNTCTFQYYQAVTGPLTEGFENNTFPAAGWDIVNPDNTISWERVTGVAKTGNACVVMRNFDYRVIGQRDYLRLPIESISNGDSAFLTFQVAAAVKTNPSSPGYIRDTLQVLISTDCGATYTSLYKKWGSALITRSGFSITSFVPAPSEWRKDSVDLSSYINAGPVLLAFMNTTENENNIYLDDIHIYSTNVNPNLLAKGFMVTPNPATNSLTVQFYPYPLTLKTIILYNSAGQKIGEQVAQGNGKSSYTFNMSRFASGPYFVQVIFSDKKFTQKVIKL